MCDEYSRGMMKVAVAKMLQTIGWNSIQSTPLEKLTDIIIQFTTHIAKSTHDYANEFGCLEPNLDHLGLAFRDHHVKLSELEEYVTYVNFGQPPTPVPKFPVAKEDNLNFLKPGSKEVVTRQVHIHEHLPPMYQINEGNENEAELPLVKTEESVEDANVESSTPVFKRPAEVSPGESFKRLRLLMEEEGRPTREISSVMMTTSGYISPAREGKLPESRTPLASLETVPTTNTNTNINNGNSLNPTKLLKKLEKKKERVNKELFKPDPIDKSKKITTMKDVVKLKQMKAVNATNSTNRTPTPNNNFVINNEVKVSPVQSVPSAHAVHPSKPSGSNKINKALAAARLKTEKLNTTITPIPIPPPSKPVPSSAPVAENVIDKLFTEPDKKKVNILKKISNVKNEKLENKIVKLKEEIKPESRESSPDLIIDESNELSKVHISNDITIELIDTATNKVPDKTEKLYFDDDSPPGTPSTPKTPEMISQSPPIVKEKRKRKDKTKVKKVQKLSSPIRLESEPTNFHDLERPKTPEAKHLLMPSPFFGPQFALFSQFPRPGLIPPPLQNALIPSLPNPLLQSMNHLPPLFGQNTPGCFFPNPVVPPFSGPPFISAPIKHEEPKSKSPEPLPPSSDSAPLTPTALDMDIPFSPKSEKKSKEHKKEKKDKIKKKNKKDKVKNKEAKKKLKEEKKDKLKKEKKEKRKEKEVQQQSQPPAAPPVPVRESLEVTIPKLTLKLGTSSPRPDTPDTKKLNIKPLVIKEEENRDTHRDLDVVKRESSPELAKISALVTGQPKPKSNAPPPSIIAQKDDPKEDTPSIAPQRNHPGPGRPRIHPIKQKSLKPNKRQVPVKDSEGNEVWICPACGRQDDGSPMIGCDDCDAWYHWVCVGIQVPPEDNEDWYCRQCLAKKQEVPQSDKKKKRKKREKKEH